MALNFSPPDWVVQEYMKRRTPYEEASAGLQQGLSNYMAIDESKRRNMMAQQQMTQSQQMMGMQQAKMGYDPNNPGAYWDQYNADRQQQSALTQSQINKNNSDARTSADPTTYYDPQTGEPSVTIPAGGKLMPQPNYILAGTQGGQPVFANPKTMEMKTGKLPGQGPLMSTTQSEGQANATLYATRMEEADKQLGSLYQGTDMSSAKSGAQRISPNVAKSSQIQMAEQSERNFLNAVLRRESGAVISPTEFKEGRKQYFEVFGDSPAVKKQKAMNRRTAVEGLRNASGMPQRQPSSGGGMETLSDEELQAIING